MSEDEMTILLSRVLGIPEGRAQDWFQQADGNRDGVVHTHEFIQWLTTNPPMWKEHVAVADGKKTVEVNFVNTSGAVGQVFTLQFVNCENVSFPKGNPAEVVVQPGETKSMTLLHLTEPYKYRLQVSYRSDASGIEDDPNAFKDASFLHDNSSIVGPNRTLNLGNTEFWMRARMLGDPGSAVLFDRVRPYEVQQGSVGDCWLMCALGSLAAHPNKLKSLFDGRHLSHDGKYKVWLYDLFEKKWCQVEVDEFLPCTVTDGRPCPTFARPLGDELWVMLLEKALAKFCGSYGALNSGYPGWAFQVLTGKSDLIFFLNEGKHWRKCAVKKPDSKEDARNPRSMRMVYCGWGSRYNTEDLFKFLKTHIEDKHVLACSIDRTDLGVEARLKNGLVVHHAYALLQVTSEKMDNGQPLRLVQLTNPWGSGEWKGDWADYNIFNKGLASGKWAENPELSKRIGVVRRDEGSFWMSYEDWEANFTKVTLCPVGGKPVPPGEASDEHVDSGEPTGFFSSLFGW